ncbi:hypothetical protein EV401DRAFT_1914743 [Pisolithus croceorrhizus]|nr:hypothetical protein EV401DRAFT_1914743 [Pisolithus croceorrhizus]
MRKFAPMGAWLCFSLAFAGHLRRLVTGRHELCPLRFCQVVSTSGRLFSVWMIADNSILSIDWAYVITPKLEVCCLPYTSLVA